MSEPRSLPSRPDLRRLREEAKRRGKAGEFSSIALAQLALAREYGFRSWPRLKFHVEAVTLSAKERAAALIASATSSDVRRARALLEADPPLAHHDLACACASGEAREVARRLAAQPAAVNEPTGPNGWQPILYACFSRLPRGEPERAPGIREVARLLLAAGADPNSSFIHDGQWLQVALYGSARDRQRSRADANAARCGRGSYRRAGRLPRQRDPLSRVRVPRPDDRAIGACLSGHVRGLPAGIALSMLDEMVMLSVQGGHIEAMRRLCDAGARIDGDPDSEEIPLSHACWRGRAAMTRELVERGAALTFRDGGSAIGAALHGSRHCHAPEGGPSMRTVDEIPKEPYAEIVRFLLDAGATVPERIGEHGARATMLIAELGIDPPA